MLTQIDSTRCSVHESTLFAEVEGEGVLLQMDRASYYGLNEIGTAVWKYLQEGKSLIEISGLLLGEYDVSEDELNHDLLELMNDLIGENLVVVDV